MKLKLVKAKKKDTFFFHKLRNDKDNRKNSVSTKKIKFSNHNNWFIKTINNKSNYIFIIKKGDVNCGYLRYEKKLKFFNVSICIDKKFRNKNIALSALMIGDKRVKRVTNSGLRAVVKKDNFISIKLFLKTNYSISKTKKNFFIFKK